MATTGFWPVKSRLKEVIDYAENPDKTTDKKYLDDDLYAALRYVGDDDKTDKKMFVSAINCPTKRAYEYMMATKRRFGKNGGNVAYHGYQSFVSDEVTPEEAHRIGMETARRMWGGDYEIVVTTHLNTDNIHNHIVVNSVSFRTGRKFENHISDHYKLREISDGVCAEYGKSVLPPSKFTGSRKKDYWVNKNGGKTHRDVLRQDVDEAISNSISILDFEYCMKNMGYSFERDFRYAHPSVIADGWKRPIRLDSLGENYTRERIHQRCKKRNNEVAFDGIYNAPRKRKPLLVFEAEIRRLERKDTVQLLFELFIELLKICTGNNIEQQHNRPLSPMMRAEVRKLDKYLEEYKLLCDHHIASPEGLVSFKDNLSSQIAALTQERYAVRLKIRRAKTPEADAALKEQAKAITQKIKPLRNQQDIVIRIEERIPKMQELLEQERNIEMKRNNLIKNKERNFER